MNPSQHVERIREILVGRQLHQVEDRLEHLESAVLRLGSREGDAVMQRVESAQANLKEETQFLRQQLQRESDLRSEQFESLTRHLESTARKFAESSADRQKHDGELERHLTAHLENISTAMASRIDARVREILQHLQTEIVHWKNQIDRELHEVRESTVSRTELKSRFARLASAAMEDDPESEDGFLL